MVEKVIYPSYFDAGNTRRGGRRVPKDLAVSQPTVDEVARAVQQVGYDAVIERDVAYPRTHWEKTGRVIVKGADDATKNDLVQAVGAYVSALRE